MAAQLHRGRVAAFVVVAAMAFSATGLRADPDPHSTATLIFAPYPLHDGTHRFERKRPFAGTSIQMLAPITVTTNPSWVNPQTDSLPMELKINPARKAGSNDFSRLEHTPSPNSGFTLGNSSVGVRTEKMLPTPAPFARPDCTGDDCADYSPLPKSKANASSKGVKKPPFLGLSITTPLQ